jgi:hypothetical protein
VNAPQENAPPRSTFPRGPRTRPAEVAALIESVCAERELPCEATGELSYAVTLPGTHKLKTV